MMKKGRTTKETTIMYAERPLVVMMWWQVFDWKSPIKRNKVSNPRTNRSISSI
jgi:hypothetical protein